MSFKSIQVYRSLCTKDRGKDPEGEIGIDHD